MAAYFRSDATHGWEQWHIGESLPELVDHSPVLLIQVDGDELAAIISALKPNQPPRCPICGSLKLQCPNGHAWVIE